MYKINIFIVLVLLSVALSSDKGQERLNALKQRSNAVSNRIMDFSKEDFAEYAMSYPRPYDLVIYFSSQSCRLCQELWPEYQYTAELYKSSGAIDAQKNPTFFAKFVFSNELYDIYKMFGFTSAPNLIVSKPYMAVVSGPQKRLYLQKFKWAISYSDGHVTTHKMLQFINKRTQKDVIYKPTLSTMLTTFFGFISVAAIGVLIYIKLKFIWTHWLVWFFGSIAVYVICISGFIYNIIHNVPFVGFDRESGEAVIFAPGGRQQYGAEGLLISLMVSLIGILFVSIVVVSEKFKQRYSFIFSLVTIVAIFWLVNHLEGFYNSKTWYAPSFSPPSDYVSGPISRDQGSNI